MFSVPMIFFALYTLSYAECVREEEHIFRGRRGDRDFLALYSTNNKQITNMEFIILGERLQLQASQS